MFLKLERDSKLIVLYITAENLPRCKFEDTPCFVDAIEKSVRLLKDGNY